MKKQSKIVIISGILLLPVLFSIFMVDRLIGTFLFWIKLPSAKEYFDTTNHFITSLYRVGAVGFLFLFYILIKWIF